MSLLDVVLVIVVVVVVVGGVVVAVVVVAAVVSAVVLIGADEVTSIRLGLKLESQQECRKKFISCLCSVRSTAPLACDLQTPR